MLVELVSNFKELITNPGMLLFSLLTLIEITPIKINPWRRILKWIGDAVNSEDRENIREIKKDLNELKADFEVNKAQEKRWHILDFVNSSRHGNTHTREEWNHVLSELADYEEYTKQKGIKNGVIHEDSIYLRELFQKCNWDNDFL